MTRRMIEAAVLLVVQDVYVVGARSGAVWLALVSPDSVSYTISCVPGTFDYLYVFQDGPVQTQGVICCPVYPETPWNARQQIHLVGWRTPHKGQIVFNMNRMMC